MKVTITDTTGANGTFDLDLARPFTNGELHLVKDVSGVRAGQLEQAFEDGDNDLMVALALIALRRAGRKVPVQVFWDAPAGQIIFENDEADQEEEAAGEPVPPKKEPAAN